MRSTTTISRNGGTKIARKKREWYPGAKYHIMFRGVRKHILFQEEDDYHTFMKILELVKQRYSFELNSYCLMTNHVHLLLTTEKDEIWKIMKMLLSRYAMEYNHKYAYTGHVFERRYHAILIEDPVYFLEVSRYIHLNPVKARMVTDPLNYDYSSYAVLIGRKENPIVNPDELLNMWKTEKKEKYRIFVEGKLSHMETEIQIQKEIGEDDDWLPW